MKIDFEKEREIVDREITFFYFSRAARRIAKCIKWAKKNEDTFFLYYFLSQRLILKENFLPAINYLNKAIKLKGSDGCAYNDKALCLADLGRHKEALECFNEGIRKDTSRPSLYHNKGWLLNLLGKHRQAIVCFNKALELENLRPEALYSLAGIGDNLSVAWVFSEGASPD